MNGLIELCCSRYTKLAIDLYIYYILHVQSEVVEYIYICIYIYNIYI